MKNTSEILTPAFKIKYNQTYTPYEIKEHFHNSHEIVFVMDGEAQFNISGKEYLVKKDSILFINNFESHKNIFKSFPYKRYFLLISQEFLRTFVTDPVLLSILKQRPQNFNHLIQLDGENGKEVVRLINIINNEYSKNEVCSLTAIGNYLNLLLIQLFRNYPAWFPCNRSNSTLEIINKIQKHIENNYNDFITLKQTAQAFNIDMYYLSHLFKEVTGFTFKEYIISQRLAKAKELLLSTQESVTEVCIRCGFNNVNHFIRIFKMREGITPLQFRKISITK